MAGSFRTRAPKWVKPASKWPVRHPDMTWETEHFRGRFVAPEDPSGRPGEAPSAGAFMTGPAGGELLVIAWCAIPASGEHKAYWEDVSGLLVASYRSPGDERRVPFPITAGMDRRFMAQVAGRHARQIVAAWRECGSKHPTLLTRAEIARELAPIYRSDPTSPEVM
jgi:hypothetical protein